MNNNRQVSFIVAMGLVIIGIFSYVLALNFFSDDDSSNSFFSKQEENISAKLENITVNGNKLVVSTSGEAKEVCIKTTRSIPNNSSLCWVGVSNNYVETTFYSYKTYYIWIKDNNDRISNSIKYVYNN